MELLFRTELERKSVQLNVLGELVQVVQVLLERREHVRVLGRLELEWLQVTDCGNDLCVGFCVQSHTV